MELDARRQQLFDLLDECPVLGGNPKHCPLHAVRDMASDAQYAWIAELSEEEVDRIFRVHAARHGQAG